MPFEWLVALRYLREGRLQTVLILAGVVGGVAVILFLTTLISQLQASIIERTLGSQAHVVIRPLEEANSRALDPASSSAIVEPRAQRLKSIDQWEAVMRAAAETPQVVAVSPVATGPAFAVRGQANKSVALLGVDADRYAARDQPAAVSGTRAGGWPPAADPEVGAASSLRLAA